MKAIFIGDSLYHMVVELSQYPAYKPVLISTKKRGEIEQVTLPVLKSDQQLAHEKYDALDYDFSFLKDGEDVLVVIAAHEDIGGISLGLLSHLSGTKITVVICIPDTEFLSKEKKLQTRVTTAVLQEYSRSGLLDCVFLVDLSLCESILQVSLKDKSEKLANFVISLIHNYFYCENNESFIDNSVSFSKTSQIATFGIQLENKDDFFVFNMRTDERLDSVPSVGKIDVAYPVEANYTILLSKEKIENDLDIDKEIRSELKEKSSDYTNIGYSIYESDYNHVFIIKKTSKVQLINGD